jgi:hypothetical protein
MGIILKDFNPVLEEDFVFTNMEKLMKSPQNEFFLSQIATAREKCLRYAEPVAIYRKRHIRAINGNEVSLDNGERFNGKYVAKILSGSKIAIFFALTLGDKIDEYIYTAKNKKRGITAAFFIKMVSSLMLRETNDILLDRIRDNELHENGWGTTCTYAPGDEGWHLSEQRKIFNILDASLIGIELTDNCLMKPLFSISGVLGMGPNDEIDKTRCACDLCSRANCIMRH